MTTLKVKDQMMSLTISHSSIKKAVKSCSMSKRYINTMLRASIINILYHRLTIEEREFTTKQFNNVSFKSFKSKSRNQFIREFHGYMTACKDAIDKNYLREFYLYFIDSSSGDIVENYKFSFKYNDKKNDKQSQNQEDLTQSTCDLLETLNDLGRHNKLAINVQVKVEFTYFEDTPEDYEPPGFRGIDQSESLLTKLNKSGNSVTIGVLFTGFHTLKCRGRGQIFNFNDSLTQSDQDANCNSNSKTDDLEPFRGFSGDDAAQIESDHDVITVEKETEVAQNAELMTEDLSQIIQLSEISDFPNPTSIPAPCVGNPNETYISQCIEVDENDSDEESNINCPCKLPAHLGTWSPDILKCDMCQQNYHAPCQGYLDKTFLKEPFHCGRCIEDSQSIVNLLGGQTQTSKPVYRIRFIVGCVYKLSKIPNELQSLFQQTSEALELNVFDQKQKKINESVLHTLFKFTHKAPDAKKLIVG